VLIICANCFDIVNGIEMNAYYAKVSRNKTDKLNNVVVHHGDTHEVLPYMLSKYNEPVFVLLDAHYCEVDPPLKKSKFPLWEELGYLKNRPHPDIISVDDVQRLVNPEKNFVLNRAR